MLYSLLLFLPACKSQPHGPSVSVYSDSHTLCLFAAPKAEEAPSVPTPPPAPVAKVEEAAKAEPAPAAEAPKPFGGFFTSVACNFSHLSFVCHRARTYFSA